MNGEHLEYSVQCLEGGLWICKATSEDLGYVKQAMSHWKKIHPGEQFRYATRIVSDWCEMFQGECEMFQGENEDEKQV